MSTGAPVYLDDDGNPLGEEAGAGPVYLDDDGNELGEAGGQEAKSDLSFDGPTAEKPYAHPDGEGWLSKAELDAINKLPGPAGMAARGAEKGLRLAAGVAKGSGLDQLAQPLLHPIDTAESMAMRAWRALHGGPKTVLAELTKTADIPEQVKAIVGGAGEQLDKAVTAQSPSEVAGHGVAAALPVIGPAAAGAGERIGSGDVAGGMGEALGMILPMLLSGAARGGEGTAPAGPVPVGESPMAAVPRAAVPPAPPAAAIPPAMEALMQRAGKGKVPPGAKPSAAPIESAMQDVAANLEERRVPGSERRTGAEPGRRGVTYDERVAEAKAALQEQHPDAHPDLIEGTATSRRNAVTGLPDKAQFERAFKKAQAEGRNPTVANTDLENFKGVNEAIGHESANELLRIVGTDLAEKAKQAGLELYHTGGDEFVAMGDDAAAVEKFMSERRTELANAEWTINGKRYKVPGVDYGVASGKLGEASKGVLDASEADLKARRAANPNRVERGSKYEALGAAEGAEGGGAGGARGIGETGGPDLQAPLEAPPMLPSEAPERSVLGKVVPRPVLSILEQYTKKSPLGSGPMEDFARSQQVGEKGIVTNAVRKLLDNVSAGGKVGDAEALNSVRTAIEEASSERGGKLDARFTALDEATAGRGAPMPSAGAAAAEVLQQFQEGDKLLPPGAKAKIGALQGYMQDLIKQSKKPQSFKAMQNLRSALYQEVARVGEEVGSKASGAMKKMLGAVDADMETAAKRAGVYDDWRKLNADWKEHKATFNDSVLADMAKQAAKEGRGETGVRTVAQLMDSAKASGIAKMREVLPKNVYRGAVRNWLEGKINHAIEGEMSATETGGQNYPKLKGNKLRKIFESVGEEKVRAVMEPEQWKQLEQVMQWSEQIGEKGNSLLGSLLAAGSYIRVGALFTGHAPAVGAELGMGRVLAKLLTKQGGVETLQRFANTAKQSAKTGAKLSPAAVLYARTLERMLKEEEGEKSTPEPE